MGSIAYGRTEQYDVDVSMLLQSRAVKGATCLNIELRRGFIYKVNCLIREESISDVSMRKLGSRDQRSILQAHAMVDLVSLLQAAENTHLTPTVKRPKP